MGASVLVLLSALGMGDGPSDRELLERAAEAVSGAEDGAFEPPFERVLLLGLVAGRLAQVGEAEAAGRVLDRAEAEARRLEMSTDRHPAAWAWLVFGRVLMGDHDGALRVAGSMGGANLNARVQGLKDLAEALIAAGRDDRAIAVLDELEEVARANELWQVEHQTAERRAREAAGEPAGDRDLAADARHLKNIYLTRAACLRARAGRSAEGLDRIRGLEEGMYGLHYRVHARARFAGELAEHGGESALEALREAEDQLARIEPGEASSARRREVAVAYGRLGLTGRAIDACLRIAGDGQRAEALAEVAGLRAEAGDRAGALLATRAMDACRLQVEALERVDGIDRADDRDGPGSTDLLEEAGATAARLVGAERSLALRVVAGWQLRLGRIGEAERTAAGIAAPGVRAEALRPVVEARARAGDRDRAAALLDDAAGRVDPSVLGHADSARLLGLLAESRAATGDDPGPWLDRARAEAEAVPGAYARAPALAKVAGSAYRCGDRERARAAIAAGVEAAGSIGAEDVPNLFFPVGDTLGLLAAAQREAGDAAHALGWLDRLERPSDRAMALVGMTGGLEEFR